jgi:hypothetical protein
MSPDDDVQQVLFYALTGQHDRLRAADSGGTLLAAAYQGSAAESMLWRTPIIPSVRPATSTPGTFSCQRRTDTGESPVPECVYALPCARPELAL